MSQSQCRNCGGYRVTWSDNIVKESVVVKLSERGVKAYKRYAIIVAPIWLIVAVCFSTGAYHSFNLDT